MTNTMIDLYVSSISRLEAMKRKLVESFEKPPDAYKFVWAIVAIVAIIAVSYANEQCRRQNMRWGGRWERNGTIKGSWRVGCLR